MDIREYSYILEIVNYGSITKAAKALYISQPSLSIYIRKLEERLGITFFKDNKFTLTPEGKVYVDYARKIVQLSNDLHHKLDDMKQDKQRLIRMGFTVTRGAFLLPKLLPAIKEEHPEIEVRFVEAPIIELETMVFDGELDLILVDYPFKEHKLKYIKLFDEEIVIALPRQNPIVGKAVPRLGSRHLWIDIHDLKEEKFILLKKGQKLRQIADNLFQDADFKPNILCETNSAVSAYNLSCTGMGISFSVDSYIERSEDTNSMILLSVGDPQLVREFVMAYSPRQQISSIMKSVMMTIKRILE